ncbi:MAG: hypothetical protein B7Y74_11590 [Novosphingobium sp. 35-62-5]|nr:MAG: hypothetical protein B7Y74_11590 [Novosphingobium sp. 35-62-5]
MTSADKMFIEPARAVARALTERGQPAYLFRFGYAHPDFQKAMGGAPHASELPYVFDTVAERGQVKMVAPEAAVAKRTHDLWVAFARSGKPDVNWPAATATDTKVMLIDEKGAVHIEDPYRARLDFVETLAAGN